MQNNLGELWALLSFILPEIFNDIQQHADWFNRPFEMDSDDEDEEKEEEEEDDDDDDNEEETNNNEKEKEGAEKKKDEKKDTELALAGAGVGALDGVSEDAIDTKQPPTKKVKHSNRRKSVQKSKGKSKGTFLSRVVLHA